jgi:hypothetical protein
MLGRYDATSYAAAAPTMHGMSTKVVHTPCMRSRPSGPVCCCSCCCWCMWSSGPHPMHARNVCPCGLCGQAVSPLCTTWQAVSATTDATRQAVSRPARRDARRLGRPGRALLRVGRDRLTGLPRWSHWSGPPASRATHEQAYQAIWARTGSSGPWVRAAHGAAARRTRAWAARGCCAAGPCVRGRAGQDGGAVDGGALRRQQWCMGSSGWAAVVDDGQAGER